MKININNIIENVLSLGIVGGLAIASFYVAQHYFGFFSYQGMNRSDVLNTVKKVEKKYPLLSRACGDKFCRGIYLTSGGMLYYRFEDDGINASYNLYSVPSELWSTQKSVLPQEWIGKYQSERHI